MLGSGAGAWRPQLIVSPFEWPKLMAGATHVFPLFSEHALPSASPSAVATAATDSAASGWSSRRGNVSAARQTAAAAAGDVLRRVAAVVAGVLGKHVEPGEPLMEAGLDSLGAVELRNSLGSEFRTEMPATVTFDYPSVSALAGYLAGANHLKPANAWITTATRQATLMLCKQQH